MCLCIKPGSEKKVATEDMVCYKILLVRKLVERLYAWSISHYDGEYFTPFRHSQVDIAVGQTAKLQETPDAPSYIAPPELLGYQRVNIGIHSYINREDAERSADILRDSVMAGAHSSSDEEANRFVKVFECVIPAGTEY